MIKTLKINKHLLIISILTTIIYLFLEYFYITYISQKFDYFGFKFTFSSEKYFITKIVYIFLLFFSKNIFNKSSFLFAIFQLLLILFYIPNSILFEFMEISPSTYLSNTFFVSIFLISPYIKFKNIKIVSSQKFKNYLIFFILIIFILPIFLRFKLNINLQTLFLSEIYETRDVFSKGAYGIVNYFYNIAAKTIIPIALVFFMINKKYLMSI